MTPDYNYVGYVNDLFIHITHSFLSHFFMSTYYSLSILVISFGVL